jgi:hypothetical protein
MMELLQKGWLSTLSVQNKRVEELIILGQIKVVDELVDPRIRHIVGSFIDYWLVPQSPTQT